MEFSDNVTLIERDGKTYYIVGTAHVSKASVREVREVIEAVKPDTVCTELCPTRHKTLMDEEAWRSLNIVEVIKQRKALMLMASLALSSFQRKMGDQLGVKPGAELLESVHAAADVGAELVLADREVQVTLKRTWANLSLWKRMEVFSWLLASVFSKEELTEEELESLKEKDQLSEMMREFANVMPQVKAPLIDERDKYLASKISEADGQTIVAVVGAGHVEGIVAYFGEKIDRAAMEVIPPPSPWVKILKWVIPAAVLSLFAIGYFKNADSNFQEMLEAWILPNSIGAGLFTLLAAAHPLTILTAIIAAPITSLNPSIGAGMVAGLVEALVRKPTVADAEAVPEAIKTFKGFYTNHFTKILLVFFMASLGSALGTVVGIGWLTAIF